MHANVVMAKTGASTLVECVTRGHVLDCVMAETLSHSEYWRHSTNCSHASPLLPCSIIWHQPNVGNALRLGIGYVYVKPLSGLV